MRLVRFGDKGRERPGVLIDDNEIADVSGLVGDLDARFWSEGGVELVSRELASGALGRAPRVAVDGIRLGAPVARPGKIVCVGQNYMDHIKEQNAPVPETPILFSKAVTALGGPFDEIVLPADESTTDWEVELAVVIGKRARRVAAADASAHVAGYVIMNDVTERRVQREEKQWHRGKSFDTFAPLGPWVATADEIPDPGTLDIALDLSLDVNGTRMQTGNTRTMIFTVPDIIAFASRGMTLMPGDILSTGTPPGVGAFRDPPIFLKDGDVVEAEVSGLGRQRLRAVNEKLPAGGE
ncbi:MAG: fumarylacetoacetate hydrolase family protein [Planctomycetota bacterium]|jgi:2-keto-4-pentenoate hydratase/2-oxohepta-3-ene-1,7-dioic acid hydratase in catechol pathway